MTPPASRPKSSWPLLLLAVTGFIPVLGFLTGSVAVTWGLMSSRPRARLATILGGIGAVGQLVLLVAIWVPYRNDPAFVEVRRRMALHDLYQIEQALGAYRQEHGSYPPSLGVLVGYPIRHTLMNLKDQGMGPLSLEEYVYHRSPDGQSFELLSRGADGVAGTPDDLYPPPTDPLNRGTTSRPDTSSTRGDSAAPHP